MAGYEDTRQKIISTLMGRPNGTEIQPENHQDYALNMLDYIRSLELIATSTLIGVAESNTTPVQPNTSRVCYIAGVAQNQTVTFENFIGESGNPISVTTEDMEGVFVILMWNTQYWSAQTFSTNIISNLKSPKLILYEELFALWEAGDLTMGMQYFITDYQTTYLMPHTEEVIICDVEPILVTATSNTTISPIAYSPRYPNDIIYYDIDSERIYGVSSELMQPGASKGYIYRRVDTINKIDAGFDWRTVKFRRWGIDYEQIPIYNDTTTYQKGDLVRSYDGLNIYVTIKTGVYGNNGIASNNFARLCGSNDIILYKPNDVYLIPFQTNTLNANIANYRDYSFISKSTDDGSLSNDIKNIYFGTNTSNIIYKSNTVIIKGTYNIKLGSDCYHNTIGATGSASSYDFALADNSKGNTVGSGFIRNNIGLNFQNNFIGDSCSDNTFGNGCVRNTFAYTCQFNTFGNNCGSNAFGNSCYSNTFGNYCSNNAFGNNCNTNTFGDGCNYNTFGNSCSDSTFGNNCYYNTFGNYCQSNTFSNSCSDSTFGNTCQSNTFGNSCQSNTFSNYCSQNTFGNDCNYNTFGDKCDTNTFGDNCSNNTFGTGCDSNTFGDNCQSNTFGDYCNSNTFGNWCSSNMFGDGCQSNTFGINCYSNTFGDGCQSNTFGINCYSNTFGNICNSNTFGDGFYSNTLGNNCRYNTFGDWCSFNMFGDGFYSNTLGNSCGFNTFGNNCEYNNFYTGTSGTTKKDYIRYIVLEDGCKYNNFYSDLTTSYNNYLQRIRIKGLDHATATDTQITLSETGTKYEWLICYTSTGELKQYCPEYSLINNYTYKIEDTIVSTWVASIDYAGYDYQAQINIPNLTESDTVSVTFAGVDVISGNYYPTIQIYEGYILVFSKVNATITIPTIEITKINL